MAKSSGDREAAAREAPAAGARSALGEAAAEWTNTRWIAVEGRPVRYREAGQGPALVLVHGLGVSADYWVRNAAVFAAAGYRVLAPDLPGFGLTEGPSRGLAVPAQAEALHLWALALGLGRAVYLGHSLSCQTILQLEVDHPDDVLGLVLAAPTGDGPPIRRLARQAVGLTRDVLRESVKLGVLVAQAYLRAGPLKVLRTWRMGARHDPLELLPRVSSPAVVLVGDRDPVVSVGFAERVATGLARGRLVIVPGGSHAVIFDDTGSLNRAVIEFLGEVEARFGHGSSEPAGP